MRFPRSSKLPWKRTKNPTNLFPLIPTVPTLRNAQSKPFKAHFTAGLALVDPDFPVSEWDRLLEQAFLTLNLLRASRVNPSLSSYAYLNGNFNFTSTPLAPPGTKVVVHSKINNRPSWGSRGREGWYIGPSLHHYRCVKCFMPTTRAEIDSDTVLFFTKSINFPEVNIKDFLQQTALDIVALL